MSNILNLKKSNCKNCYKCIRHCPVKSIRFSGNQAHIVSDECILCGQCFVVCPQNAKEIVDSTEIAKILINSGEMVFASIAPSFVANYAGISIASMEKALLKLGFYGVEETAIGATIVKKQYEKIVAEKKQNIIISSSCPSVNLLIQKHYPAALQYLARVVTPMQAHSLNIKKSFPNAKTVFIGPCIAKKDEAERYEGIVDCVLTFEELTRWFEKEEISLESIEDNNDNSRARFFPTAGGILKTMDCSDKDYSYISVDGVENCINVLNDISDGKISNCFIEMSVCAGSCIGGPVMEKSHHSPISDYQAVEHYAGKNDFTDYQLSDDELVMNYNYLGVNKVIPSSREIEETLKKMGKVNPEDELNCGSCGYNTCREKAVAVIQGKADLTMCLPFLKDKAESFSSNVFNNTPNGIIVINESLEVQQINNSAQKLFKISNASDVLGDQVIRILNPTDFINVLQTGNSLRDKRMYLAEYNKYVEETIIYDKSYHILLCIFRDVTEEEIDREKKEIITQQTVEVADKVVEKQMRVVQEIASLLGETVSETKIALSKLKESLNNE